MSHSSVYVFQDKNSKSIEEILAPFDENLIVPKHVEYTKEQAIQKVRAEIESYRKGLYAEYLADPEKYKKGCTNADDAKRLVELFDPKVWETTVSVICEKSESVKSSIDRQLELIRTFTKELISRGASVRVFNPAGQDDIGGGCGQLWFFQKWLNEKGIKHENQDL